MKTLIALKKLAKRVCSKATDEDLKFLTTDEVIGYIADHFDGGSADVQDAREAGGGSADTIAKTSPTEISETSGTSSVKTPSA